MVKTFHFKLSELKLFQWISKLSIESGAKLINFVMIIRISKTNSDQKSQLKEDLNLISV